MEWISNCQKLEIDLIISIQNYFFKYEKVLAAFSTLFGSTFMYVFIIPLLAAINTKLYHKALISCLISDFVNLVLKWILSEDRPYWWIHETKVYTSLTRPTLYQTERTCETSPGSPSGHMMIAASFLFVMLIAVEKLIVQKTIQSPKNRRPLRYLARTVFALILIMTAISRMYFATHFLHQCIFGALMGISISETLSFTKFTDKVKLMEKGRWFSIGCIMAATVTSLFWLHKLLTGNPMESVHMAFKYCTDPLFPKPETTVIFSSIRSIAKVAGLLLAAPLSKIAPPDLKLNPTRSIPIAVLLMFIQWQLILSTPKVFKLLVFYAYTFIVYAIFQYLFLTIIPKYCAQTVVQKLDRPKQN